MGKNNYSPFYISQEKPSILLSSINSTIKIFGSNPKPLEPPGVWCILKWNKINVKVFWLSTHFIGFQRFSKHHKNDISTSGFFPPCTMNYASKLRGFSWKKLIQQMTFCGEHFCILSWNHPNCLLFFLGKQHIPSTAKHAHDTCSHWGSALLHTSSSQRKVHW